MSLSLPVYRMILREAVIGDRKAWVVGWSGIAVALSLLGGLFAFALNLASSQGALWVGVVPLAALALFCWLRYVPGAVRQNSPANARLVPGLNRSVRRATVLAWCLMLAPLALFASAFEHAMLVFIALGVSMTALGMARGGRAIGTVIHILMTLAYLLVKNSPGLTAWLATPAVLAGLSLLGIALAWDAVHTVFPAGGERHWKLLRAQAMQRVGGDMHETMRLKRASGVGSRQYALLLRRDLIAAAPAKHLLMHALGPFNHRFDFVVPLVSVASLALAVRLAMAWLGLPAKHIAVGLDIIVSFSVPLILMHGLTFHRFVVSMANTRGEQALVRLAPRTEPADRLGRSLARQLLQMCLVEWLACGLVVLEMMLLFGGGVPQVVLLATVMATSLAMSGWALRDYSGKQPAALTEVIVQAVLMATAGIALFVVRDNLAAWTALLVLMLGGAYAIINQRWKVMVTSPVPFPAGRFA